MKYVSIALTVSLAAAASFSVVQEKEIDKESEVFSFQPKPLDDNWSKWLVGEWEGLAESDVGNGEISMKIELDLNGQFLTIKSEARITKLTDEQKQYNREILLVSDEEIERFQNSTFTELQVHTIDPWTGEIVGYLFDSMRCVSEGKGERQGNKEIMEWKWSANSKGVTSVCIKEKISNDKFTINHKYTLPNGNKMEDRIEMIRKKTKTGR